MKKVMSGICLMASWACAVPAFAAVATQPTNGFVTTPDPEWASAHAEKSDSSPEHRDYHRMANQEHQSWHEEHAATQGTEQYTEMHRMMHQERNMAHRLYHNPVPVQAPRVSVRGPRDAAPAIIVTPPEQSRFSRRYEGSRPARRTIMRDAKEQNGYKYAR